MLVRKAKDLIVGRDAVFSECGQYRYLLERHLRTIFDTKLRTLLAVLLNPSKAGADYDDPTTIRMVGYAYSWGFNQYFAANLGAFIMTDSKKLKGYDGDLVGPDNDEWIVKTAQQADMILIGWGRAESLKQRASEVLRLLAPYRLYCLGKNKDGSPVFPLYQKATLIPVPF